MCGHFQLLEGVTERGRWRWRGERKGGGRGVVEKVREGGRGGHIGQRGVNSRGCVAVTGGGKEERVERERDSEGEGWRVGQRARTLSNMFLMTDSLFRRNTDNVTPHFIQPRSVSPPPSPPLFSLTSPHYPPSSDMLFTALSLGRRVKGWG